MPSGNDKNNDANEECRKFKNDLKDALDQLDAISRRQNLPNTVAEQTAEIQKMLRDVQKYTVDNRFFPIGAESVPKRR